MENQISAFGEVLLFIVGAMIFVAGGLITAWLVRPDRPNFEKLTTYECGEDPVGSAWGRFNVRFYVIALVFILFDVEIVFLFPWSVVFGNKDLIAATNGTWGWFSLIEMVIFIIVLLLGLAYAWVNGFLDWVKPEVVEPKHNSPVPAHMYEKVNEQYRVKSTADGITG